MKNIDKQHLYMYSGVFAAMVASLLKPIPFWALIPIILITLRQVIVCALMSVRESEVVEVHIDKPDTSETAREIAAYMKSKPQRKEV